MCKGYWQEQTRITSCALHGVPSTLVQDSCRRAESKVDSERVLVELSLKAMEANECVQHRAIGLALHPRYAYQLQGRSPSLNTSSHTV